MCLSRRCSDARLLVKPTKNAASQQPASSEIRAALLHSVFSTRPLFVPVHLAERNPHSQSLLSALPIDDANNAKGLRPLLAVLAPCTANHADNAAASGLAAPAAITPFNDAYLERVWMSVGVHERQRTR